MKSAYDVIVVGAGPAGSVAAMRAAESGFDVLLIEKRQEIGTPVRCGEAISAVSTEPFIRLDPRWIDAHIDTYAVYNSEGDCLLVPPTEPTLIVNRKVFDYELALRAARAGAEVRVSTSAVGLLRENGRITGVRMKSMGLAYDVKARLVIAADGTESQVARWAGLKTIPPMADYYVGIQFLLSRLKSRIDPNVCQYHVGASIAPGGYAWVFPKSEDTANVGLVISSDRAADASPQVYLERFVARHYPESSVLGVVSGGIPVTGPLKRMVTDGLMVVGDAAHQADPLLGGGINLGMAGAEIAVEAAVPAIQKGDTSAGMLRGYEVRWQERYGRMHDALYKMRKIVTRMSEDRFNDLIKTASTLPLAEMSQAQILEALLKNHPGLLLEARTLIATGLIIK